MTFYQTICIRECRRTRTESVTIRTKIRDDGRDNHGGTKNAAGGDAVLKFHKIPTSMEAVPPVLGESKIESTKQFV
jgi:hypothetical protein